MGTGKRRINLAGRGLEARVVGSRGLEPELARVAAPELAPVQVAVQAPVLVQGVAELEHARAEAELERGLVVAVLGLAPVVAVPGLGPVVAVPGLGHLHDQLGALRRTRSAIEAHHRGQVPLLAAEDSAAVVETTHDPAATEAVVAWAVAVTVVAVAPE
jgi:hypothetical protein